MTASTEPTSTTNEAVPSGVPPAERAGGTRRVVAVEPTVTKDNIDKYRPLGFKS